MTPLYLYEGELLVDNGALAVSEDCCCGTAENTCNDCDPPIPDTLYVTFPSGLSGDFAPYAGNTYELTWDNECYWDNTVLEGNGGYAFLSYTEDHWSMGLWANDDWCRVYFEKDIPDSACDPEGDYPVAFCYGFDCDDTDSCSDSSPIGDATVSE